MDPRDPVRSRGNRRLLIALVACIAIATIALLAVTLLQQAASTLPP